MTMALNALFLGRELDINQIDYLTKQTKADIEVFYSWWNVHEL